MSTNFVSNQWTTKIYKEKNAMMFYVLRKVGMFKKLPFYKIYEFSNLDVYTFMEHMHVYFSILPLCTSWFLHVVC